MAKILSTLLPTYRHFYTTWNNSPEEGRTVKLLLTKLQEEEAITEARIIPPQMMVTLLQTIPSILCQLTQIKTILSSYTTQPYSRPKPYSTSRGGFQIVRGGYQGLRRRFQGFRGSFHQVKIFSCCGLGPHKVTNCRNKTRDEANQQYHSSTNMSFQSNQTLENLYYSYKWV